MSPIHSILRSKRERKYRDTLHLGFFSLALLIFGQAFLNLTLKNGNLSCILQISKLFIHSLYRYVNLISVALST